MLVVVIILVALVVFLLRLPTDPGPTETKRVKTFSRVPWTPKEIDVPVSPKRPLD